MDDEDSDEEVEEFPGIDPASDSEEGEGEEGDEEEEGEDSVSDEDEEEEDEGSEETEEDESDGDAIFGDFKVGPAWRVEDEERYWSL